MATRRIHLEDLLGRDVHDVDGRRVGSIEELVASRRDDGEHGACFVEAYVLGREGLAERLSITGLSAWFVGWLGARRHTTGGHHVPWHLMDLTDPRCPRLRCTAAELQSLQTQP